MTIFKLLLTFPWTYETFKDTLLGNQLIFSNATNVQQIINGSVEKFPGTEPKEA